MKIELGPDTSIEFKWGTMIAVLSMAIGLGVWMATIEAQGRQQTIDIRELQEMQKENIRLNKSIESRLSRIEATLEIIKTRGK